MLISATNFTFFTSVQQLLPIPWMRAEKAAMFNKHRQRGSLEDDCERCKQVPRKLQDHRFDGCETGYAWIEIKHVIMEGQITRKKKLCRIFQGDSKYLRKKSQKSRKSQKSLKSLEKNLEKNPKNPKNLDKISHMLLFFELFAPRL